MDLLSKWWLYKFCMQAVHEKIRTSEHSSFRSFPVALEEFKFLWHFHPEYELTLILKGRGRRYIGDSIEEYTAGDLVLVGSGLPHTWQSDSDQDEMQQAIVVQFSNDLFRKGSEEFLMEFHNIEVLLRQAARGLVVRISSEWIDEIISMPEKTHLPRLLSLYTILQAIYEYGEYRMLASESFQPKLAKEDQFLFDQVHSYLEMNLAEKITLKTVADHHHMTSSTFSRFFKRNTGKTLIEYVNNLRIGKACELLISSDHSVTEIAFRTGYSNLSHFNRMFLRLKKMSPTFYKKYYIKKTASGAN